MADQTRGPVQGIASALGVVVAPQTAKVALHGERAISDDQPLSASLLSACITWRRVTWGCRVEEE